MHSATVYIAAEENIPMGVITDIKEQLRNARALKVRYETDDRAIEKRLPPAV
jgi:RNA-binding protein YhbY